MPITFSKYSLFSLVLTLVFVQGCKKDTWGDPYLILEYITPHQIFSKEGKPFSTLSPDAGVRWVSYPGGDSVRLQFYSVLQSVSGSPTVTVTMHKKFYRGQYDLDPVSGQPLLKNNADFNNLFKNGSLATYSIAGTEKMFEGVDLYVEDGPTYSLQATGDSSYIPLPAHKDTANYFEIVQSNANIDFSSLMLVTNRVSTYRGKIVTFRFKSKLFNTHAPYDSLLLTDGVFQGFFMDR